MKTFKRTLILCTVVMSFSLTAGEKVEIEENIDIKGANTLYLDVEVGEVDIKTHNSDEISLDVVVKESDSNWFKNNDLDDVELTQEIRKDTVYLSIDVEDTKQNWKLLVPEHLNLKLKMGVGEIQVDGLSKDIDIHLGVGDTEVFLADNNYSSIELDTGVGDADLDGFDNQKTRRSIVSKSIEWLGNGSHDVNVEVGVGDVEVSYR